MLNKIARLSNEQLRGIYRIARAMRCTSEEELRDFDEDATWHVNNWYPRQVADIRYRSKPVCYVDYALEDLRQVFTTYHYNLSPETIDQGGSPLSADTYHVFDKDAYESCVKSIIAAA